MPIIQPTQTPSGVTVSYHKLLKVEGDLVTNAATAIVSSYSNFDDMIAGKLPSFHWSLTIPIAMLSGENLLDTLEQAMITQPDLPFFGGSIVMDETESVGAYQSRKLAELRQACNAQIIAGFQCDALGSVHLYPAKQTDQTNLAGSIIDSLIPDLPADWTTPFWCADAGGVWDFRPHTAAQIQKAGRDGKSALLAAMGKNEYLGRITMTAMSKEQVAQVGWNLPVPTFEPAPAPETPAADSAPEAAPAPAPYSETSPAPDPAPTDPQAAPTDPVVYP